MLVPLLQSWSLLISFLTVLAVGAIVAVPIILWLIAWQRRRDLGQQIYEDGPATHTVKRGTPTMGGLAFVAAAVVGSLLFTYYFWQGTPLLLLVLAAAAIGFADDYLKLVHRRALGLRARAKFGLLLLVACAFVAWEAHAPLGNGLLTQAWFGEWKWILLPTWVWGALAVAAIVGAANAVNLTDGLDGLAAGTILPPLLFVAALSWSSIGVAVVGACAAFLFFNRHPARIFMGDTGSLALGALLGGLAAEHAALLILPLIGVVFVAEALSVMLQVAYFKMTGKRIFKMSPLHHHFEMSGWTETRVTLTFIAASLCATVAVSLGLRGSAP
jgi:phospho-N-acetylmuramoyl-pentapeptide-transferase